MKNPYVKNRVEAEQFEFNFFEGSKRVPVRLWPKLEEETAIQTLPPDYHYEN